MPWWPKFSNARAWVAVLVWAACALPSYAQDFAGAAKVMVMTGRVSILRDGSEWALNLGSVVAPKQVIITGLDGYAKFQLADGSTFEVFQNSKTIFQNTPGWIDLLEVLIGRVKVQIQHQNGPNPNRVTTQTAVISVRGTTFDVVVEDEETTFVSVDDGVVSVRHALFPTETELHAGESIRVYRNQPLVAKRVNKGAVGQQALRMAAQAIYEALYHHASGGGTGTGASSVGGGEQADQGKNTKNAPTAPPSAPPSATSSSNP